MSGMRGGGVEGGERGGMIIIEVVGGGMRGEEREMFGYRVLF